MFHSSGFRLHDHEPHVHRAGLDERREAKSWWPLNPSTPLSLQHQQPTAAPLVLQSSGQEPRLNLLLDGSQLWWDCFY